MTRVFSIADKGDCTLTVKEAVALERELTGVTVTEWAMRKRIEREQIEGVIFTWHVYISESSLRNFLNVPREKTLDTLDK